MNREVSDTRLWRFEGIKICERAKWMKSVVCPRTGFSQEKQGEDLEAAILAFGLLVTLGECLIAEEKSGMQEELRMVMKKYDGMKIVFNNGTCKHLSMPPAGALWNRYCYGRFVRENRQSGAAVMGAWVLATSGFRLKRIFDGVFLTPDPIDAYLITSLLWLEMGNYRCHPAKLEKDPLMYFISLSQKLGAYLEDHKYLKLSEDEKYPHAIVLRVLRGHRPESALAELSAYMKETETVFQLTGEGDILMRCVGRKRL